jgi:hypothetical protein
MKNDLTTGAWQHDIECPISITFLSTSDVVVLTMQKKMGLHEEHMQVLARPTESRCIQVRSQAAEIGLQLYGLRSASLPMDETLPQGFPYLTGKVEGGL